MTKKVDETLKKTSIEKKKTSLRITKKNNSKTTKKVILETPILEQIPEKKTKRTISRKKPMQKAIGSLNDAKKEEIVQNVIPEKIELKPETQNIKPQKNEPKKTIKKSHTSLKPNSPKPNSQKNSHILDNNQILVKPKRTLKLNIASKITSDEEETINSIINFENVPVIEASPIPTKKEVSINQNSAFFYEPSIFQKFNIEVSSADEEIESEITETSQQVTTENNSEIDDESIQEIILVNDEINGEDQSNIENETEAIQENIDVLVDEETSQDVIENIAELQDSADNTESVQDEEPKNDVNDEELINALLDEIIEEELAQETPVENFDFVSNEIPEEFKEEVEKNLELSEQKQKFIENASNEYDFISTEIPDIYKPGFSFDEELESSEINVTSENIGDSEVINNEPVEDFTNITINDSISDDKIFDIDEIIDANEISIDDIDLADIPLDDAQNVDNLIEVDFTNTEDEIKQESADNLITDAILKETQESAITTTSDTAIGKFFDSSIPSINQESDDSYFKKIKKSLFSNISTVFKKFSYEEASLLNSEKENFEEASPILGLTQTNPTNEIKQVLENFDNNEENVITNSEVSAEPNTLVIPSVDEKILEAQEISAEPVQDIFTNIVTPQANPSTQDISLDDIDINDFDISDIEDIIEQSDEDIETEQNNTEKQDELESTSLDNINEFEDVTAVEDIENIEYSDDTENVEELDESLEELSDEDIDNELNEIFGIDSEEDNQEDDQFSIEEYFGVTPNQEDDLDDDDYIEEEFEEEQIEDDASSTQDEQSNIYQEQIESFSKLIENFTQTISTLSNKISELETNIASAQPDIIEKNVLETPVETVEETIIENEPEVNQDIVENNEELEISQDIDNNNEESEIINDVPENSIELSAEDINIDDINLEDISLDDISLDDINLEDIEEFEDTTTEEESLLPSQEEVPEDVKSVEDILLEAFDNPDIDDQMKQDLLSEVLSVEETIPESSETNNQKVSPTPVETETTSDFFKIIDSLSKTISELEKTPDIVEEVPSSEEIAPIPENTSEKAINILINKDDIFSIAILNETYEIVTDFDGISVLSENIHISTPKNNFYVNIGDKYIEIHKKPDLFVVNTNFEDIEFANAINNITFAKKKNKIELNIKEAFKISSINKKIELSMLNTSIANLAGTQENSDSDASVCDNRTLVINEETQKVYLPYTIEEVMKKLNSSSEYQSLEDVIEQEYTLPLSTFKMPIISRFKEAYRFMRVKEKSSVYAALDLAIELMFNSNLNPAVIRASKDLKELNIYLDCLYENEIEKFDCFKVIYKVLPKIQ